MYKREDIDSIIRKFVFLASADFPIKDVYLFGSYAKNNANEDSDIDIAVVSDNFEGIRYYDREKLAKYLIKTSYDLEVHPYKTEDFTDDDPFVKEIIETGIKII